MGTYPISVMAAFDVDSKDPMVTSTETAQADLDQR
jgi:hypothetical protein